ncbi:hypothetical protein Avbf_13137 [Armadillidium vulgare]|nr:hypothetical protein Avbf_13137 [Armadillidium vulgare]
MQIFMFNGLMCWSISHEFYKLTNKLSWHNLILQNFKNIFDKSNFRDSTYGSDSYWKSGSRSYPDSRSRFDDRSSTNDYNNASRSYQPQVPNPPGGNFGNSGNYNSRNGSTGPSGPPNFNSGPQGYNSNSAPGNYASGGPNFGGSGPPPARQQGPMSGPSTRNSGYGSAPTENLFSSIQTLSEIGKNDFASKILSAVLQTNLMGAVQQGPSNLGQGFMGNQQGPRYNDNQCETSEEKEKENDDNESSEKKDDIPLQHYIVISWKFTSVTYLYHLDGVKHRKTAMAFHARNETTLDYLRTNAQLANVRFGGKESGVPTSQCTVCSAIIKESFKRHRKLLEHRIVNKFLSPTCCGRYFKNRYDMNEHRLSLPHLRKIYEANEEKKICLEDVKAKPGKWNHDDIVKQLMSRNPVPEKHLTLDNIPPFDGNTLSALNFFDQKRQHIANHRKRKMEGGFNKEGKDGEERFTDSDDSDEEKDADGNPDSSRFSRLRERDEDDDDDDEDEEGAVVAVKGSDDEDEKDDMPFFDEAVPYCP